QRLRAMARDRDIPIRPRPVYPLAVREPGFFKQVRPQWVPYLLTDVVRLADYLGRPISILDPDPIVMDLSTGEVESDQPHIGRLARLDVLAAEDGCARGRAFRDAVSTCIWTGRAWTTGDVLANAVAAEGFDLAAMDAQQNAERDRLEAVIRENEAAQAKHHW